MAALVDRDLGNGAVRDRNPDAGYRPAYRSRQADQLALFARCSHPRPDGRSFRQSAAPSSALGYAKLARLGTLGRVYNTARVLLHFAGWPFPGLGLHVGTQAVGRRVRHHYVTGDCRTESALGVDRGGYPCLHDVDLGSTDRITCCGSPLPLLLTA